MILKNFKVSLVHLELRENYDFPMKLLCILTGQSNPFAACRQTKDTTSHISRKTQSHAALG